MREEGVDLLFLGLSADLEYLTGAERGVPNFGETGYAHGWVAGAFFRPDAEPVFVLPRMVAAFELQGFEPPGESVVVNETDDGDAIFARVVGGLGSPAAVAVGDRVPAETVLHLGRILGFERLRTGSALVNELRRVKSDEELAAMGRAIDAAEATMAAVGPKVVPGVSMLDLLEEVEHELLAHGSRTPSFATHIFTGLGPGELDSGTETAREPIGEGVSVMFDFGAVVDGYCSDFGRTVYCGEPPADYRETYDVMLAAQEAGRAAARAGVIASRGERRLSRADRGGGSRRALPPPHGPRDRAERARAAVHLGRGRDAARAGHDLHRRAVDHHPRALQRPDRGHRRLRGVRRAQARLAPAGSRQYYFAPTCVTSIW